MKKICRYPFHFLEILPNLSVYTCSGAWNRFYSFGNLEASSFEEIWSGQRAKNFRRNILSHDYSLCSRDICVPIEIYPVDSSRYSEYPPLPKHVKFTHDWECNYKCPMCRNESQRHSEKRLARLDGLIDTLFVPLMRNVDLAEFAGSGEPFVSRHYRKLITALVDAYPNLKFRLSTNGSLCDEKHIEELGVEGKIEAIQISMHAATQETYRIVTGGEDFQLLLANISQLSAMRKNGEIEQLFLCFVVSSINFREIPKFIQMLKLFDAQARFWEIRDWGAAYAGLNVCDPMHPEYGEVKQILKQVVFSEPYEFSPVLRKIAAS